ncbi:exodeoxyribonuclease V subunit beta [Pasteurellaceae bacterium LIM206]|nr:exodeoxyribonuclease V subunit beta [Pasteurellaceae bacterium LIM206]
MTAANITALDPLSTPLNSTVLIEASAGTGKTYTIASLYLRLLLKAGQNSFSRPLTVDQILVVTFTEAATQELRERIRQRIHLAKQQLITYRDEQNKHIFCDETAILADLVDELDLAAAIRQLHLAEQSMDLASIYTIHSFCRRMLLQYAFNSGIHFQLELLSEEGGNALLERFAHQYWREQFYDLPFNLTNFIHQYLVSPKSVVSVIKSFVTGKSFQVEIDDKSLLELPLTDLLHQHIGQGLFLIDRLKTEWLAAEQEIIALIDQAKGKKWLKGASYKANHLVQRYAVIHSWAQDPINLSLPDAMRKYFSQTQINESFLTGQSSVEHKVFSLVDQALAVDFRLYKNLLLYHYLRYLQQEMAAYKRNHSEKGFDDLLRLLNEALQSAQGEQLAQLIRHQYPFAMIDEFQDTDEQQYQIFHKIYIEESQGEKGFLMIGDPKQAIYQFRGADIFTYLKAAKQARHSFTLAKNFRSNPQLIDCVNRFFDFSSPQPFFYQDIHFSPVKAGKPQPHFVVNDKAEPMLGFYVTESGGKEALAELCAASISRWLALPRVGFRQNEAFEPVCPKDIAVLVRSWHEAQLVKDALQKYGISSVYLSDRSNVFDSREARDLQLILQACLNPFSERPILNAVATSIFALNSAEIQHIKQNENEWEQWVERFVGYQQIWHRQGVLAMLHRLFRAENIPQKLVTQSNGERRITDLFHLAELLQQASALNESDAALVRWLERQIQGEERSDEQQIRLESEQELVKIVTVHKSKGLEYGVVWLPFVAANAKGNRYELPTYHAGTDDQIYWDIQGTRGDVVQKEALAEEMRLFYVALTRAKSHIAFGVPSLISKRSGAWSAFLYSLSPDTVGQTLSLPADQNMSELLEKFSRRMPAGAMAIYPAEEVQGIPFASVPADNALQAAEFHGKIERDWQVTSFTALSAMHDWNRQPEKKNANDTMSESTVLFSAVLDQAKDLDIMQDVIEDDNGVSDNVTQTTVYPVRRSPFDFPHGANVGTELHRYFEQNTFRQVNIQAVEQLCTALQLDESWLAPTAAWLDNILHTPLTAEKNLENNTALSFSLSSLAEQNCLKEMQFYLKLEDKFDTVEFNRLLRQYHHLPTEGYRLDEVRGLVRGFIDLVFRHEGRYYILDYKSNFLDASQQSYQAEQLKQAMLHSHYDLQYLLYSVALHRYLRQRDPDYRYESHFGGVIYAFLRGMNGENADYGIYTDVPHAELIYQLEQLF